MIPTCDSIFSVTANIVTQSQATLKALPIKPSTTQPLAVEFFVNKTSMNDKESMYVTILLSKFRSVLCPNVNFQFAYDTLLEVYILYLISVSLNTPILTRPHTHTTDPIIIFMLI